MDQDQVTNRGISAEGQSEWEGDFGDLVLRAKEKIEDYVQERPHAALGIAAAVGFVLGGGLTPRRLIRLGFAAGGPLLSRQLASEAFKFVLEMVEQPEQPKPKRRGKKANADSA
jgi:hypothetical protein